MRNLTADILNGEYDKEFDRIIKAINERRRVLRSIETVNNLLNLKPGDKVETHGLSPKYLNGMVGVVVKRTSASGNSNCIPIRVDNNRRLFGRRFNWDYLLVPANCLIKIEE